MAEEKGKSDTNLTLQKYMIIQFWNYSDIYHKYISETAFKSDFV